MTDLARWVAGLSDDECADIAISAQWASVQTDDGYSRRAAATAFRAALLALVPKAMNNVVACVNCKQPVVVTALNAIRCEKCAALVPKEEAPSGPSPQAVRVARTVLCAFCHDRAPEALRAAYAIDGVAPRAAAGDQEMLALELDLAHLVDHMGHIPDLWSTENLRRVAAKALARVRQLRASDAGPEARTP